MAKYRNLKYIKTNPVFEAIKNVTIDLTTYSDINKNQYVFGPITVNSDKTWKIAGDGEIIVLSDFNAFITNNVS